MPTKREKRTRNVTPGITSAAVEHFRQALVGHDRYMACVSGEIACLSQNHCPECLEYFQHAAALRRELGIRPWEPDPLAEDCPARDELIRRMNDD